MVAGPVIPGEIAEVPWWRAVLGWMLIMLLETVHGIVRNLFIAPVIGDLRARQTGVLVGSALVFAVAWLTSNWLGAGSRRALLRVGALWVTLTLVFEMALGRAIGASWDRILADYNPLRGGFMMLGLAFMFVSPQLAAKLHRSERRES